MCHYLMRLFLIVRVSEISFQPEMLGSQLSGYPTVSTRSACVTTPGLSNSFNTQCLCHNSRAVQQFQPAVLVSQLSGCPTVPTRSAFVTTLGLSNSYNRQCLCHNSRSVQQFQPAVLVSQL